MRPASPADLPAITDLLVRANETPYDIGRVAEEKVFGRGVRGETVVRVYEESRVIRGVAVTCGEMIRLIAVDPGHRRRGIGSRLMQQMTQGRVAFAETGNYFTPGVVESDVVTRTFFAKHGFIEESWTSNLETTRLPEAIPPEVQRVSSASRERVLDFVAREFGPAWRFECENAGDQAFFMEHDGDIAGFAAHDANNRGLGFFGPTGVAESMRGRGFGTLLLQASLADLRTRGYTRVIIPWTDAIEFYAKACGATVNGRFVMMTSAGRGEQRTESGEGRAEGDADASPG